MHEPTGMHPHPYAGALFLTVGAPGSGKSTWTAARFPASMLFGLDMLRGMLSGDVLNQDATDAAVEMLQVVLRYRLDTGRATVVDATNAGWERRDAMRFLAARHGRPFVAVRMHTPLPECLRRNVDRSSAPWPGANDRPVPAGVVERMFRRIEADPPGIHDADLLVDVHPDGASAVARPGAGRPAGWCEDLLAAGSWGNGVALLHSQDPLPWDTEAAAHA